MAAKYSVEIRDQYGKLVTVINRPMNKEYALYRNKAGYLQFTMDVFDPQATNDNFALNQYDVVFRRFGTPVAAGQLSYLSPVIDTDKKEIGVNAVGHFDLLQQRMINFTFPNFDLFKRELVYSSVDGGAVIADLINSAQFPFPAASAVLIQNPSTAVAQSFVSPGNGTLTSLKLLLEGGSATIGNLIVGIYSDSNGVPGSLLTGAQASVPASGVTDLGWYPFTPSVPPVLSQGVTYWIKAYIDTAQTDEDGGVYWSYVSDDYYPSGKAYSEDVGLFLSDDDLMFFIQLDDNSYQMTQNTYMGLTQGLLQTSFAISPIYPEFKKVRDAITEITQLENGVDFNISVAINSDNIMTKQFNVFYPGQGIDNTNLNFIYPGNIIKLGRSRDGKTMVNALYTRGQGTGQTQSKALTYDPTSIQTYGFREDTIDYPDIANTRTLQLLGQEGIRVHKDALDVPNLEIDGGRDPQIGSYGIGDTILIQITNAGILNFTDLFRIEGIIVKVDDDDFETVTLMLSRA